MDYIPFLGSKTGHEKSNFYLIIFLSRSELSRPVPPNSPQFPSQRIHRRERQPPHSLHRRRVRPLPAQVPPLRQRIRPNHQKIPRRGHPAMPRPTRQHGYVPRPHRHLLPARRRPAQQQPRLPRRKSQHLMRRRMVVVKRIHPVPPLRPPSALAKQRLHGVRLTRTHHPPPQQHRQRLIVRHPPVPL